MTSCEARSPAGRRSCRNYVKRCFVVMLCCVLVFTMVPPPKAEATAGAGAATATLVASGAVAAAPVAATVGVLCLAALGISFFQGYYQNDDSIFYGSRSYEVGLEFRDFMEGLDIPEHVASWWSNTVSYFEGKGGVAAGDTFTIPADVAEYVRAWATTNYDFSNPISFSEFGILSSNGEFFSFSEFNKNNYISYPSKGYRVDDPYVNSVFSLPDNLGVILYSFEEYKVLASVEEGINGWKYAVSISHNFTNSNISSTWALNYYQYTDVLPFYNSGLFVLGYDSENRNCYLGCYKDDSVFYRIDQYFSSNALEMSSSIVGTDVLDVPIIEDVAVKVPALPTEKVGEMDIPIIGELAAEDVLVGEIDKPIDPPITGEDTMVGDIALEDIAGMERELGALFISKFPFSIPWDLFRAVKLLAAPPEAPYWEVDFLAPMEHRVGSWKGDTTVVIDMSEYEIVGIVCRWTSTLLFCAALIGATKRLIWTA